MILCKGNQRFNLPALGQDDGDDDDDTTTDMDLDSGDSGSSASAPVNFASDISSALSQVQQVASTVAAVEAAVNPPTVVVKKAVVPVAAPVSPLVWIIGGVAVVGVIMVAASSK
jgi:hypothetical protein